MDSISFVKILTEVYGYEEDNKYMDIKLVVGYIACIIGGGGGGYSYLRPFAETKLLVTFCCALYPLSSSPSSSSFSFWIPLGRIYLFPYYVDFP